MAPPLYFLPKISLAQLNPQGRLNRSLLASRGIDTQFADVRSIPDDAALFELAAAGPGGQSGCVLCALPPSKEPPLRLGYYPEFQEWTECLGPSGALWIGVDNEHPVTAEDLARPKQFDGYLVELAGQSWKVPIVRDPSGGTRLPRSWVQADDGQVQELIKAAYLDLWTDFIAVVDLFFNPDDPAPAGAFILDRSEALRRCLQVLGLNYRVGRFEQNLLGLVDAENWTAVLAAAVDIYGFYEVYQQTQQKKSARAAAACPPASPPAASAPAPGSPGDSPTTVPAAES